MTCLQDEAVRMQSQLIEAWSAWTADTLDLYQKYVLSSLLENLKPEDRSWMYALTVLTFRQMVSTRLVSLQPFFKQESRVFTMELDKESSPDQILRIQIRDARTEPHRLKCTYTPTLWGALAEYRGQTPEEAEKDKVEAMSDYLAKEIDVKVVSQMTEKAVRQGAFPTPGDAYHKAYQQSARDSARCLTWAVAGTEAIIQMRQSGWVTGTTKGDYHEVLRYVGKGPNDLDVYHAPFMQQHEILWGRCGNDFTDSSAILALYRLVYTGEEEFVEEIMKRTHPMFSDYHLQAVQGLVINSLEKR